MISVHSVQAFAVSAERDLLSKQVDQLMEALLELEAQDARVHSAAVAVDYGASVVEVEVSADAADFDEAERLCAERVRVAIELVTGQRVAAVERHTERVPQPA